MAAPPAGGIVPAQLGFLAIFNPSLGGTDETLDDQIVYYASTATHTSLRKKRRAKGRPTDHLSKEERHERLRQVGLAQGMVNFSRGFSDGAPVDAIDTERSRVIAHEVEPGWWILASVDLNKVPLPPRLPMKPGEKLEEKYEYTSREMKPAALLLRDLLRAHGIFLLHHGSSLSALFSRSRRSKFAATVSRFWDLFLSTWSVMLHGNPIRDIFRGINVAASGELGVGVGEEERGSGEREVLEGLVGRIEGLVDLVVSRFGSDDDDSKKPAKDDAEPWLGSGKEPSVEDGAVFLGTGALSRASLRDVTHWMEDLYTWGEHAYGVIESPNNSNRRSTDRKAPKTGGRDGKQKASEPPVSSAASHLRRNLHPDDARRPPANSVEPGKDAGPAGLDKMVSYLRLGYGSYWSLSGALTGGIPMAKPASQETDQVKPRNKLLEMRPNSTETACESSGYYLIGLRGDIEEEAQDDPDTGASEPEINPRTVSRTVHVKLEADGVPEIAVTDFEQDAGDDAPHDGLDKCKKLRVVVYVNKPFIFTFLFRAGTESLGWDSLYRSLHYQLAPLRRPLLGSTAYRPERPDASIHDLVWDPHSFTVHSTIPNISEQVFDGTWSRADGVSTHINLLNVQIATRRCPDVERTQKTNRGWWIVWTRIPQERKRSANLSVICEASSSASSLDGRGGGGGGGGGSAGKEIYLVRRASDHVGYAVEAGDGAGRLAQGIGVDTRRYIEELLSLL